MSRSPNLRRAFGMMTDVGRALGVELGGVLFVTMRDAGDELDALERELEELRRIMADRPTSPSLEAAPPSGESPPTNLPSAPAASLLRARVAELEKERAGILRTLEATREDLAATRAELEASVEAHGRTSRDLADAREELLAIDRELAAANNRRLANKHALEALVEGIEARIIDFELAPGTPYLEALVAIANMVQRARRDLNMQRGKPAQDGTREQSSSARRSRSNARATEPKGSGRSGKAPSASTPRNVTETARLPELPPPAPAPGEIAPIPPEGEDKTAEAPNPEKPGEVQNG